MAKAPRNPALFADGTDGLDVKTLNITNRSQVCGARSAARFDHPNLLRVNASAAFHAAVLAQPKKIRDGTEAAQPPEYPAYLRQNERPFRKEWPFCCLRDGAPVCKNKNARVCRFIGR